MIDIPPARKGRLRHPAVIWAAARDDYLAGDSAPRICERYGLAASTFHRRAAAEGWRRVDQAEAAAPAAPSPPSPVLPDFLDRDESEIVAELAWRMATGEIYRGRLISARGWTRLHRDLAAIAASRARAIARGERLVEPPRMEGDVIPDEAFDDGPDGNFDPFE